jgi:hypothetical protein
MFWLFRRPCKNLTEVVLTCPMMAWARAETCMLHVKTQLDLRRNTGRFIMFSVITNTYNKKIKGPTLMESFTTTWKLKTELTARDSRCVRHGWHGTHRYDIQVLTTHASTRVHRCSSLLQWSMPKVMKNIDAPMLTRVWQEAEYRIYVCRVTRGAHIEHL